MDITHLKSRMKICTKREDGFIFEEYLKIAGLLFLVEYRGC